MKNFLFLALTFCFVASCMDDDDNRPALDSSWELAFAYTDPGDGSGDFEPVTSDAVLDLFSDGRWTSNSDLCSFGTEAGTSSEGDYSTTDGTLTVDDCATIGGSPLRFAIRGDTLDLNYLCIEPCVHRYLRR